MKVALVSVQLFPFFHLVRIGLKNDRVEEEIDRIRDKQRAGPDIIVQGQRNRV